MDKIEFYQERTFGEKFNVTFEFVKQNWKILLRYISYGILPLSFVGAFALNSFVKNSTSLVASTVSDSEFVNFIVTYASTVVIFLLSFLWLGTSVYSLMQAYNLRRDGLEGIAFDELKPLFKRNAWRLFKCGLVSIALVTVLLALVILLAAFIHWILAFFICLAIFALTIPLLMVPSVYVYEDVSVWKAYGRGISLGWKTWGGIFALGFVLTLLTSIASSLVTLPWEIFYLVQVIFGRSSMADTSWVSSVWFMFLMYVFGIVMLYSHFVINSLFFISCSFLYSHAAEQQDDMSLEAGIAQFSDLADNHEDEEEEDIWS